MSQPDFMTTKFVAQMAQTDANIKQFVRFIADLYGRANITRFSSSVSSVGLGSGAVLAPFGWSGWSWAAVVTLLYSAMHCSTLQL